MKRWQTAAGAVLALLVLALLIWRPGRATEGDEGDATQSRPGPENSAAPLTALVPTRRSKALAIVRENAETDSIVTGSWGALLEQTPIPLAGGGTARVGIESKSVALGGGVLLYCLVEGAPEPNRFSGSGDRVGPLEVRVRRPGLNVKHADAQMEMLAASDEAADGLLFTRTIAIASEGTNRVQLFTPGHDEVPAFEIAVTGTAEVAPAWFPFSPPHGQQAQRLRDDPGDGVKVTRLELRRLEAALPRHDGITHTGMWNKGTTDPAAPLPKLIPDEPDPGLRLERTTSGFAMETDGWMVTSTDGTQLLARWWVNGAPVRTPDERAHAAEEYLKVALFETRRLEVDLDFDPSVLGANPGDRVGLQLLHCPGGSMQASPFWREHRLMQMIDQPEPMRSRLSNRIEFVAE